MNLRRGIRKCDGAAAIATDFPVLQKFVVCQSRPWRIFRQDPTGRACLLMSADWGRAGSVRHRGRNSAISPKRTFGRGSSNTIRPRPRRSVGFGDFVGSGSSAAETFAQMAPSSQWEFGRISTPRCWDSPESPTKRDYLLGAGLSLKRSALVSLASFIFNVRALASFSAAISSAESFCIS
jgi:hypothetical protein